jgi:hypothetical protein
MSQAPVVTYADDTLAGEKGITTPNGLFFSVSRLNHLVPHQFMLESRSGVQPHGIWEADSDARARYGNLMMFSLSYADRAWERVNRGSSRVIDTDTRGSNTSYDVQVSTTHFVGRAVRPNGIGGTHTVWSQTVRLVVGPQATTVSGAQVRPVITCFPI